MKVLNKVVDIVTILAFIAMMVTTLLQILFRTILKISVPWTEELSRLLFIYAGFLGTAIAAREKQFIIIDVLTSRLPKAVQAVLYVVMKIVIVLFFSIMWFGAVQMFGKVKNTYFQSLPAVSNGATYVALIIGAGLTVFYTLIESIDTFRKRGTSDD
ncbi:MAG: TRAP transporter small permease [Clostridiales bacterium]|nr:TRAP transporter small permease [Clostridiales bacterium]